MVNPNSYQLFFSKRSPFARRIRLAMKRLNLPVEEKMIDVFLDHPDLISLNPLGMVPTLRTPEGFGLFDSNGILEQLHDLTGEIWPQDRDQRIALRQASLLAAGLTQSVVAFFQETSMHQAPSEFWAKDHFETVERTLMRILNSSRELWIHGSTLTQAGWDFAVALDYLVLRMPALKHYGDHPLVMETAALANQNDFFRETRPTL